MGALVVVTLVQVFLLCGLTLSSSQIITSSLPDKFFNASFAVNIVAGSVVQLFCTADTSDAVFTWNRADGIILTNDPPHIRVRSSNPTTSILTIDNFVTSDNGVYQCRVGEVAMEATQLLTAFIPNIPGDTLFVAMQPSEREHRRDSPPFDNRTAVARGSTIDPIGTPNAELLLGCAAAHFNDSGQQIGNIMWMRNGQVLASEGRITVVPRVFGGRYGSKLQITNFMESDAGIYQCVATDAASSDSDIATSIPFRLDTDIALGGNSSVLRLERVSPEVILLVPPNKLVIELMAFGRYQEISWTKDGLPFGGPSETGVFVVDRPNELPNFAEMFVRGETSTSDLGTYSVTLTAFDAEIQTTESANLQFNVIHPAAAAPEIVSFQNEVVEIVVGEDLLLSVVITGFNQSLTSVTWSRNGVDLINGMNRVMIVNSNFHFAPATSALIIGPIVSPAADGGRYTVSAQSYLGASTDVIFDVNILALPIIIEYMPIRHASVVEGGSINLTCTASGIPTPSFGWFLESSPVLPVFPRIAISTHNYTTDEGFTIVTSTLTLSAVGHPDAGSYVCIATNTVFDGVKEDESNFTVSINSAAVAFFQLRLKPIADCVSWTETDREGKFTAIINAVVRVVQETCLCIFTSVNIITRVFSCITSTDDVVFKAVLMYMDSESVSADELVKLISQWVKESPSIAYGEILLSVDPTCPTESDSLIAADCSEVTTVVTTFSEPLTTSSNSEDVVAATAVLSVTVVVLVVIVVTIATILAVRKYKLGQSYSIPAQQAPQYEEVELKSETQQEPEVIQNLAYEHMSVRYIPATRGQLPDTPIAHAVSTQQLAAADGQPQSDEAGGEEHVYDLI